MLAIEEMWASFLHRELVRDVTGAGPLIEVSAMVGTSMFQGQHDLHLHPHNFLIGINHLISDLHEEFER